MRSGTILPASGSLTRSWKRSALPLSEPKRRTRSKRSCSNAIFASSAALNQRMQATQGWACCRSSRCPCLRPPAPDP
jgi:hypothetical protein